MTLIRVVVWVITAASIAAPAAAASPNGPIPAAAQGHPYRHGLVPRRGQQLLQYSALPAPTKNLSFGGGISGVGVATGPPKVYLVFWGSQWGAQGTNSAGDVTLSGDPDGMAPYLQEFMKGVGTGGETWSGVMTQYCQGISTGAQSCPSSNTEHVGYPTGGALAGVWVDESAASPSQSTATQLAQEALNAAAHFNDYSSSSQYVIVSPTGTSPDGFATSNWCAWHDYTGDSLGVSSPPGKPPVAFTNLPYVPDAGASCGQGFVNSPGTLDGVSIVGGHEYAETITDTFPAGGWTDSSGSENGDKCAWISSGQGAAQNIALSTGSFPVQSTWANDASACEISHPIITDPSTGNTVTVNGPGNQTSTYDAAITPLQMSGQDSQSGQTLTWSATGLPAGLSINSTTGVISGTPTAVGSGTVTVTATDTTNASGSTSFTWTVGKRQTSTSISCSPSSVTVGVQSTCTATVTDTDAGTPGTPTGTVSITGGASCTLGPTGTTGVASCQAGYTPTTSGAKTITGSYAGDATHKASTSSGFGLTAIARSTSTSLACSPTTLTAGASTTCTATVSDTDTGTKTTPTGTVSLSAAPTGEGSFSGSGKCTLSGTGTTGQASCTATYTPSVAGSPTITAAYQGDNAHAGSSSDGSQLAVADVTPTTSPGNPSTTTSNSGSSPSSGNSGTAPPQTGCPTATGKLGGSALGPIHLGMTRTRARAASGSSSRTSRRYQDFFCLTPVGIRAGYASPKLLAGLAPARRKALKGRVVWITTANAHYSAAGMSPGTRARHMPAGAKAFKVGRVTWYLIPGRLATTLIEVQGGVVREVGIAATQLGPRALVRSLS